MKSLQPSIQLMAANCLKILKKISENISFENNLGGDRAGLTKERRQRSTETFYNTFFTVNLENTTSIFASLNIDRTLPIYFNSFLPWFFGNFFAWKTFHTHCDAAFILFDSEYFSKAKLLPVICAEFVRNCTYQFACAFKSNGYVGYLST